MAPTASFACSVCEEELTSISTLHYHHMCLHTTEELSLAILTLRELPLNASPRAGDGGTVDNVTSPSTDCEDMLLRNGLAKYPQFLHCSGGRKSKVLNSEKKHCGTDDCTGTPNHTVNGKENIRINKSIDKSFGVASKDKESAEGSKLNGSGLEKGRCEPARSSLWGAIKTLDGKAVDAPIVKIDKKRHNIRCNKSVLNDPDSTICPENSESVCKAADLREELEIDKQMPTKGDEVAVIGSHTESVGGKEKILEKHLKHMNMASFDDVIEFECSDGSDEEEETYAADGSCDDEGKSESMSNIKNKTIVENNTKDRLVMESVELKDDVDRSKALKNRRFRGKIQKHRSWYRGSHLKVSSYLGASVKDCISVSIDPGKSVKTFESQGTQSEVQASTENSKVNATHDKVMVDFGIQTEKSFLVDASVDQMSERSINKDRSPSKKISPKKKKMIAENLEKSMKELTSKDRSINNKGAESQELFIRDRPVRVKTEVIVIDGEKRFFCGDCSKTYKKRSHLERHRRVHTGERPFVCPYCEKGFSVRSILNQHIRIHTGEKPYACTICAARFPQKSGLMTHMMLHTGKPFKCDQCDKAFVSNHKLIHHLKSHDGDRPHVCELCNSAFFTAAALNDHKSMHSRNRKHVCNKCNASFVHEVYLKIHLATHLLEADCENPLEAEDVGSVSSRTSGTPHSNASPGHSSELTLTLDAIDQFCNGETIMMDLSV